MLKTRGRGLGIELGLQLELLRVLGIGLLYCQGYKLRIEFYGYN